MIVKELISFLKKLDEDSTVMLEPPDSRYTDQEQYYQIRDVHEEVAEHFKDNIYDTYYKYHGYRKMHEPNSKIIHITLLSIYGN